MVLLLEPNVHLFSFNHMEPALFAKLVVIIGIDAELVIPNTTLSIYENAIFRRGDSMVGLETN
jgi:excinuclease ABC subunit A